MMMLELGLIRGVKNEKVFLYVRYIKYINLAIVQFRKGLCNSPLKVGYQMSAMHIVEAGLGHIVIILPDLSFSS